MECICLCFNVLGYVVVDVLHADVARIMRDEELSCVHFVCYDILISKWYVYDVT